MKTRQIKQPQLKYVNFDEFTKKELKENVNAKNLLRKLIKYVCKIKEIEEVSAEYTEASRTFRKKMNRYFPRYNMRTFLKGYFGVKDTDEKKVYEYKVECNFKKSYLNLTFGYYFEYIKGGDYDYGSYTLINNVNYDARTLKSIEKDFKELVKYVNKKYDLKYKFTNNFFEDVFCTYMYIKELNKEKELKEKLFNKFLTMYLKKIFNTTEKYVKMCDECYSYKCNKKIEEIINNL